MKNFKGKHQHVIHLDEKVLKPNDRTSSGSIVGNNSLAKPQEGLRPDGLKKSLVGKPSIYDMQGNLLAQEENLVVLKGREYLAQLVAHKAAGPLDGSGNPIVIGSCPNETPINGTATACDYTNYVISHFAVGDAGTDGNCPPNSAGPYDNDINLYNPKTLFRQPTAVPGDYLSMGLGRENMLKKINFDGEIEIVTEEHTINLDANGEEVVQAYTAIRYRMYINPGESTDDPDTGTSIPFRFNEAGLYAVEHDASGNPVINVDGAANYLLFARFTTLDKYLEESDGIMIEWYILV